jgi:hypothetical protein
MTLTNKLLLVPLVRTTRAISACTICPNHPIIAIASSEVISYITPFIENCPLNALNNMILFLFSMIYYNKSSIDVISDFIEKNLNSYLSEIIISSIYLFLYFK